MSLVEFLWRRGRLEMAMGHGVKLTEAMERTRSGSLYDALGGRLSQLPNHPPVQFAEDHRLECPGR